MIESIRKYNINTFPLPQSLEGMFKNILTEELRKLVNLFYANKFEIRIAGGAVRDILMGIIPHDVDFATDATPSDMKKIFTENNIRLINSNGESHGTIIPRINDKENFEVTTLRYDKITDGRRAEVAFTKDWRTDAERRDLTINSMFLDVNGIVYDYCNGMQDIDSRTVRFVGNTGQRIQEDYLRILRYFRFFGRIAKSPDDYILDTINQIREHGEGLQGISGERVWMELRKIICGNFVPEIMQLMKECNIFPYLGLSENTDLSELKSRYRVLKENNCHPAIILSTMLTNIDELEAVLSRLKISKEEYIYMAFMINNRDRLIGIVREKNSDEGFLNYCKDTYIMHTGDPPQLKLRQCFVEFFKYINRGDLMKQFEEWEAPRFPVRGNIVAAKWAVKGKQLGRAIQFLKRKWQDNDYGSLDEGALDDDSLREEFMKRDV